MTMGCGGGGKLSKVDFFLTLIPFFEEVQFLIHIYKIEHNIQRRGGCLLLNPAPELQNLLDKIGIPSLIRGTHWSIEAAGQLWMQGSLHL